MIEVRNLVKDYGNHVAVNDISFTIEGNHVYGFLGPNGAGKSTTMNVMTGYIGATSGDVIINGHNILDEPEKAKRFIGYLPEQPPLYKNMTVEEYLKFVAELKSVPKAQRRADIEKVMEQADLADVRQRLIKNLSKGYKQRVGLAQALIGSPEIIILDEPTVGLDPKQIIEIRDLIKSLAENHTVILSSHILSEVQEVCDRVIIIHHGKLIAEGSPEELEQQLGSSIVEVTVKADSEDALRIAFSKLENVSSTEYFSQKSGEVTAKLTVTSDADIQEQIYNACVSSHLTILMLKSSEFSLEQIFLELTDKIDEAESSEKNNADSVEESAESEILDAEQNEASSESDGKGADE